MKFFLLKKRDSLMRKMSEILHTIKFTYLLGFKLKKKEIPYFVKCENFMIPSIIFFTKM